MKVIASAGLLTASLLPFLSNGKPPSNSKQHWAFQPVKHQKLPDVKDEAWALNPIGRFLLAKLEPKGLDPNPSAKPAQLLRRAHLDLIGLPPTLSEQEAYARKPDLTALVNDLIDRPGYGERYARHWLDVVRYADSNGYERDAAKPEVWRYRDYVIRSLNADKSFDQFIIEQLAGDEVEDATTETILLLGAKPIFVDIDSQTYNLDVSQVGKQITSKTKAILPVHLYGHPADMKAILSLARAEGLFVIEDTAQAIGAQYFGAFAGTLGNLGCFSFFPSKNLGAFGDAGAIVTNDTQLAEQCRMIRLHGSRTKYRHEILGVNSRLDTIQAAVLKTKLPYLEGWLQKRIAVAKAYNKGFENLPLITPFCASNVRHVYHQYSLCTSRRDELATFLKENGVGSAIHYPVPLHRQGVYDKVEDLRTALPNSERIASEIISLPMFPELTESEIETIISVVCKFYSS